MNNDRPTISELEAILNSEDDRKVTINPDGTITVGPSEIEELRAEVERLRAALRALYEWYDRDGSVGGASEVFEAHRSHSISAETVPQPKESPSNKDN